MINNLNDLAHALITIIFDYRKAYRAKDDSMKETEVSITDNDICLILSETDTIAQKSSSAIQSTLTQLIADATQKNPTRLPLLNYLLHIVIILKQHAEKSHPEMPDAVLKETLFIFLQHLKQLCYTHNRTQYISVPIGPDVISIQGLVSTNSTLAVHIQRLILNPLHIEECTEDDALNRLIDQLIIKSFIPPMVENITKKPSNAQLSMFAEKPKPAQQVSHEFVHPLMQSHPLWQTACNIGEYLYQVALDVSDTFEAGEDNDDSSARLIPNAYL